MCSCFTTNSDFIKFYTDLIKSVLYKETKPQMANVLEHSLNRLIIKQNGNNVTNKHTPYEGPSRDNVCRNPTKTVEEAFYRKVYRLTK